MLKAQLSCGCGRPLASDTRDPLFEFQYHSASSAVIGTFFAQFFYIKDKERIIAGTDRFQKYCLPFEL